MSEDYDEYQKHLLQCLNDLKNGLTYYHSRNKQLEIELEYYKNAYENRVNESLKGDK